MLNIYEGEKKMTTCSGCGKQIDVAHYHNGVPYCTICATLIATTEGQCANCGMYLPITEMKMWASRYYCNYCIMDVMDEEERAKKIASKELSVKEQADHSAKPHIDKEDYYGEDKVRNTCERCGRAVEHLYSVAGRRLCEVCKHEHDSGSGSGSPGILKTMISALFKGDYKKDDFIDSSESKDEPAKKDDHRDDDKKEHSQPEHISAPAEKNEKEAKAKKRESLLKKLKREFEEAKKKYKGK